MNQGQHKSFGLPLLTTFVNPAVSGYHLRVAPHPSRRPGRTLDRLLWTHGIRKEEVADFIR
jgi:hypothetical protein